MASLQRRVHSFAGLPRIVWVQDFGGPGNDAASLVVPDLSEAGRGQAAEAIKQALEAEREGGRVPNALQLGCVPVELEQEVRTLVEDVFTPLKMLAKAGEALRYAPAEEGAGTTQSELPPSAEGLRLESIDREDHPLLPELAQALQGRGYPAEYVHFLTSGGEVVAPLALIDDSQEIASSKLAAFVLQEALDLSLGGLQVDEARRRQGLGAWLLKRMGSEIAARSPKGVVASLVEGGNEASVGLHAHAGWTTAGEPLGWWAFGRSES